MSCGKDILYSTKLGGKKLGRIWRFIANPPKFYPPKSCPSQPSKFTPPIFLQLQLRLSFVLCDIIAHEHCYFATRKETTDSTVMCVIQKVSYTYALSGKCTTEDSKTSIHWVKEELTEQSVGIEAVKVRINITSKSIV